MTELIQHLTKARVALLVLAAITQDVSPQAYSYILDSVTKLSAAIQQLQLEQRQK
jgi:hypothetical protein